MPPRNVSRMLLLLLLPLLLLSSLLCTRAAHGAVLDRTSSSVGNAHGLSVSGAMALEVAFWFADVAAMYELSVNSSASINLTADSSDSNIAALLADEVDFALVIDVLSPAQAAAHPNVTLLPVMATALVPAYRLDALNASTPLVLSGITLALIFIGNITTWDDALIAADNPGVTLPAQNITVCYQSDRLVGNLDVTRALNHFLPSIAAVLPPSYEPAWPLASYASSLPGTEQLGVVSNVVSEDGTIGITSLPAAIANHATSASMRNRAGTVVQASPDSVTYAIEELLRAPTLTSRPDLTDAAGLHAWPLAVTAYLLLANDASPRGCDVRQALLDFWEWYYLMAATTYGPIYEQSGIVSLPSLLQRSLAIPELFTDDLTCDGAPLTSAYVDSTDTAIDYYGADRLGHLLTTLIQFRDASAASSASAATLPPPTFQFNAQLSAAAAKLGEQTDALVFYYPSEVLNGTSIVPPNVTDFYQLPMFLISVVMTFNPQLSPTVRLNASSSLVIDWATIALILLDNVTDWHHPRLLALNPALSTLLDASPAPITLVFGCKDNNPLLSAWLLAMLQGVRSYDVSLYERVLARITDPVLAVKFYQCLQVFDAVRIVYSTREDTIPALVGNTAGAVGYGFGSTSAASIGTFGLMHPAVNSSGGTTWTVRHPTAHSLLACAAGLLVNLHTMVPSSVSADLPDCWPITQVVYAQIPRSYSHDMQQQGLAVLQLLQWMNNDSALDTWANNNLLVRTAQLPHLQAFVLNALESVTSDGDTLLVTLPVIWRVNQSLSLSVDVLASLGWFSTIIACFIVLFNRSHAVFRSASPLLMVVSLTGVVLAFVCAILLVESNTPALCTAANWTGQLAFTLVFCPLLAKTYRIYRIFGRQRLKVVRITNRRLLTFVFALVVLDATVQTVWQLVAPMTTATTSRFSSNGVRAVETVYTQCASVGTASQVLFIGTVVVKALLLVAGVLLAFGTRQVSDAFNESKSIGLAIYNIIIVVALIGPIIVWIDAVGNTLVVLMTFGLLWISAFTLAVLVTPKLLAFYSSSRAALSATSQSPSSPPSQSPYAFLSLSQLTTPAMIQTYLTAIEQHVGEVKRRLGALKRVDGLGTGRLTERTMSRSSATSRPETARGSLDTVRGSARSVTGIDGSGSGSGGPRGSRSLIGLAGWRKGTVAPSKSNTPKAQHTGVRSGSLTVLPPLRLPHAVDSPMQAASGLSSASTPIGSPSPVLDAAFPQCDVNGGGRLRPSSSMRQSSMHMAQLEDLISPPHTSPVPKLQLPGSVADSPVSVEGTAAAAAATE